MSSDEEGADALMASFKTRAPQTRWKPSFSPANFVSDPDSAHDNDAFKKQRLLVRRKAVAVRIPPMRNRNEFTYYEPQEPVTRILREFQQNGSLMYKVKFAGGGTRQVSFDELLTLEDGPKVFQDFQHQDDGVLNTDTDEELQPKDMRLRSNTNYLRVEGLVSSSEDEAVTRKPRQKRLNALRSSNSRSTTRSKRGAMTDDGLSESDESGLKRRRRHRSAQEPTRRSSRSRVTAKAYLDEEDEDEDEGDEEDSSSSDILRSDVLPGSRKRKRRRNGSARELLSRLGTRQSERSTRAMNDMREANINDIYRSDSEPKQSAPKIVNVKEVFQTLPRSNLFRARHVEGCEVCYEGPSLAPLIYCQGCSLAYHKNCLGHRSGREHMVTKVADDDYILQCRRCINVYQRKDPMAPDLSMCQDCRRPGVACKAFRHRKTAVQEQKERDENDGQDPVVDVPSHLVNNPQNVLFRCTKCWRAYHYHHLAPLSQYSMDIVRDEEETADERFQEYSRKWLCKECTETGDQKVSVLVAWRPSDVDTYRPGTSCDMISEDHKQYLIKWEGQSYLRVAWFSGAWTWGVTAVTMRKAFFKREDGPKMRTEDAIPEEFLRIDIVLDIKYTSRVQVRSEEIDKARIKEVDRALIKYKGLGYEDAVWEKVPTPEDGDRWLDFVTAYNDWVAGRYIRYPRQVHLKARIEKARNNPFAKLEKQKQPEKLIGGDLMKYQLDGLNWLYYQWFAQKNGILADEMGLGKTIQVIAFMATLIEEHTCFPFLIVVPNSTCANWRREIKQWVPDLRVVTYFGSATARDMASKYEMFPEGSKELRAHIVVTSYDAAADDSCRRIIRGISWAGLIVDEGQRLKNDKSQLYAALTTTKAPFRLLLTGTPLQNNARELFNLLQFLDESIDAAMLEEKYAETTSDNIRELHDQIRPFILRRTKAQVLTFLPPLGQIIVPLSMSTLQKSLYKSILAKNPELLKALFTATSLKAQERTNLSNILMQLRKCLCHPFVYSREIEERTDIEAISHRNLVEASAKLQLLELLLPKLKERGHRVLIFSQFLDMLSIIEDFLDGMQMAYQRLDGTMGSLEKQKRIDQFNAPDSALFAFLLSTRAGGVGINLATADTVIILDPDFNPHQDIQAISRAHRIGQKKKVLCYQLMTRTSVEEKIIQMGRKKMALDHIVVEQMDAEDIEDKDVESILKFGAAELFKDDYAEHDIRYDDASIDKLLDRSQIENTKTSSDNSAESQFSFARVWANDQGALEDTLETVDEEVAPDPGVWGKILKERQAAAAAEALARATALGRGKRARVTVNYETELDDQAKGSDSVTTSPVKIHKVDKVNTRQKKKNKDSSESDTDFQAEDSEDEDEFSDRPNDEVRADAKMIREDSRSTPVEKPLSKHAPKRPSHVPTTTPSGKPTSFVKHPITEVTSSGEPANGSRTIKPINGAPAVKPFERARMPIRSPVEPPLGQYKRVTCPACHKQHPRGACELKAAGVEHCGLCGLAHFGHARTCPHIRSETQVREMLHALKSSPEKKELVDAAVKYLRGVKGHLVQYKKKEKEKAMMQVGLHQDNRIVGKQAVSLPAARSQLGGSYHGSNYANGTKPSYESAPPETLTQSQRDTPYPTYHDPVDGKRSASNQSPSIQVQTPPYRAVPSQRLYQTSVHPALGSEGSYLATQSQRDAAPPQQRPINPVTRQAIEDQEVENALIGFLGR